MHITAYRLVRPIYFLLAVLPLLWGLPPSAVAQAEYRTLSPEVESSDGKRVALVIGNADYDHTSSLQNPTNDAEDIAAALSRAGFWVVVGTDLSYEAMEQSLTAFGEEAIDAATAAFFYAGHGVQVGGENYLIPVDADIRTEAQVRNRAMALAEVFSTMENSGARLKLVILDACRDNPFRSWRSGAGGWASTEGPAGSVIVFATAPGSQASDNQTGSNGLYTEALLAYIETPGFELSSLLRRVTQRVIESSGGEQAPWMSQSYHGDFYFFPEETAIPTESNVERRTAMGIDAFERGNFLAAIPHLKWASNNGHGGAQTVLGFMYEHGQGMDKDDTKAAQLYLLAAEQGVAAAQNNLGLMYEHGRGLDRDATEAAQFYNRAVEGGIIAANNNLGVMYEHGRGVDQDDTEAVRLYGLASDQGIAAAQSNLGFMYEHGRGVEQNDVEAARLYRLAAEQNHEVGQLRLGLMYEFGRGVQESCETARHWYRRAADQGSAITSLLLGSLEC